MTRIMAEVVLALHGLIHLLGFSVYWKLAEPEGFTYPETLLAGNLDADSTVIRVLGILWLVGALGFVTSAICVVLRQAWWQPFMLLITMLSLLLCALAFPDAWAGIVLNIVILAIVLTRLWLAPVAASPDNEAVAYKLEGTP